MPYALLVKASAANELEAIDGTETRRRIVDATQTLAVGPRPSAWKKLAGREAAYRLRICDYRIVYTVNDREIIVEVIKFRRLRKVYGGWKATVVGAAGERFPRVLLWRKTAKLNQLIAVTTVSLGLAAIIGISRLLPFYSFKPL